MGSGISIDDKNCSKTEAALSTSEGMLSAHQHGQQNSNKICFSVKVINVSSSIEHLSLQELIRR